MTFTDCLNSVWGMVNYVTTGRLGTWVLGCLVVVVIVQIVNRLARR